MEDPGAVVESSVGEVVGVVVVDVVTTAEVSAYVVIDI